jgi:radical SAM superfamily enzyme YgiQ (UPF0313 family)
MEPLPPATLAGLTPPSWDVRFYDDRMEPIPFDEETDLVAISVETYTAKRAYQIASEYRQRGVPVVMGGFHATLVPDEVSRYCEALVVGEAEGVWPQVLADAAAGRLRRVYRGEGRPPLGGLRPDRSIFAGKRYLSIGLVEAGRGCTFTCEFCAIQSYFGATQTARPTEDVLDELGRMDHKLVFFVDDNIVSHPKKAKEFFRRLAPLGVRWVGQASLNAAHDDELLALMKASGCQGLLFGFESLDESTLRQMNKRFNTMGGGYEVALANLRRHGIRLYVTFILGYDDDTETEIDRAVAFARRHRFYIAAFNHLTPFPGTPLYARLEREGRLRYERWWLDPDYRYNTVPFWPGRMSPEAVQRKCVEARAAFYSWPSILRRAADRVNAGNLLMASGYFTINTMLRREVRQRDGFPLGDAGWRGELIEASHTEPFSLAPVPRAFAA